jgi:ribosomal protein S18 acetylase RimI-like enzyme
MSTEDTLLPTWPDIRPMTPPDVPRLAQVLVAAFFEDPVTLYLFPRESSRRRRLERYFVFQLRRIAQSGGEAWTTGDLSGVSLWLPPRRQVPTFTVALGQLFGATFILGLETGRALALIDQLERLRPKEAHYYLAGIGVDPALQRKGVGSRLLQVVLDRVDEEQLPVYLESSKEENLSFYFRHGFEVTGEVGSNRGLSPRLWCMCRQPKLLS